MRIYLKNLLALSLLLLSFSGAWAQCYGNPQAEAMVCSGTPITYTVSNTCGNCTHTWYGTPISGQGTATATYVHSGYFGSGTTNGYIQCDSYDPNYACWYVDVFQTSIGNEPNFPSVSIANGPWDGDTNKVWLYTRSYYNPIGLILAGDYEFTPSWTAVNGTVLQISRDTSIYATYWKDSVWVKWDGAAQGQLIESQTTYHYGQYGWGFYCGWSPTPMTNSIPPMAIFHSFACSGSATTFYTYPYPNSTYTWSVTNGSIVGGQGTSSAQIVMNGNGTVSVVRDSMGTITNASSNVVPTIPVVNLGPDQTICQYSNTTLTADPGFTNYLWSNGSTGQSITVSAAGQYSVIADVNGACFAYDTINISNIPATLPNLGPDTIACAFPVSLDAGSGFLTYNWNNGANTQNISVNSGGVYVVSVTDANGCTTTDSIEVNNQVVSIDLGPNRDYCDPGIYYLIPISTNATSYWWSTGSTNSSLQVSGLGAQTFWLEGSNAFGCSDRDTVTLTGIPRPTVNLGADTVVCPGTSVVFDAGTGYTSYSWWPLIASTQTITTNFPTDYIVTVGSANGCTAKDTINLSNFNVVRPNLGPDINVCTPTTTLDAGSGYISYLWSNGANTQIITIASGGQYVVTATDANGCNSSDTINVTFSAPNMTLGPDTIICEPLSYTLDPQLVGVWNYVWSNGATTPTITLSGAGTYPIILNVTNNQGCAAVDTVNVTILPAPTINLGTDTVMCTDTFMVLDAGTGPGFLSYQWNTGATSQSITTNAGGVFFVEAPIANGCIVRDTIMISGLIDCVFPGDYNYDGVADLDDALTLGAVLGHSGTIRNNANLNWYGQQAYNWTYSHMQGVNAKQVDGDGNGLIEIADTMAISLNFGSTHTKSGSITTATNELEILPLNSPVVAGGIARFGVYLRGENGTNIDSLHGLALKLQWPSAGLAGPGLISTDASNSWIAASGQHFSFSKVGGNILNYAISRTANTDTSGSGLLFELAFQTDGNLPFGQQIQIMPTVIESHTVGMDLNPKGLQVSVSPMEVLGAVAIEPQILAHVRIWPIPAKDQIQIDVDGQMPRRVQLVNLMGQTVIDEVGNGRNTFKLDVSQLPAGNYCVQVQTRTGLVVKKVVIAR